MEVRLYSSSPPPLDEGGEEEDEDEFGDFGGYCTGVSSSLSFSEFDTPTTCSQSHADETSPPDLCVTSSSGKTSTSEDAASSENLQASSSISKPSVNETSDDCEAGELDASEIINGVLPSDLKGAPPVVSNTGHHRSASISVPQDFEASSTSQQKTPGIDGEGHEHSRLNLDTALQVSTATDVINTETGRASRTESSTGPSPSSEISKGGGTVVDGLAARFQEVGSSNMGGDQSIDERKDQQEQDQVSSGLHPPSGEGCFASPVESESEDFGDWTETLAEVEEVSGAQPCKDLVDHTTVEVPDMEPREDLEEVGGTTSALTAEEVPDSKVEVKGTMEMGEDFGGFRDAVGVADFSRTESATQEGFADFVTALSGCSTDDGFGETDTLKDWKEEEELPEEEEEEEEDVDKNPEGSWCTELPPSDSFADFSSAPLGGLADRPDDSWVAFGLQEERLNQQESWAAFDEEHHSGTAIAPPCDRLQNANESDGLSCKLQTLFRSTFFPSEVTSEVTEVVTLQDVLEPRDHGDRISHPVQGEPAAMWHHLLDTHSAHGLKVQWVGSHSNRILLDCLGIRNILFSGQKKRPMIVPMFASGLGMLEPTKDPVNPSSPAPRTPSSSPGQGRSALFTLQVAPSLSCREDGTSQRRASFSVTQGRALRHSRQKSYS